MVYPTNYGFIPHTLTQDGDPCDVLVVTRVPVMATAIIRCRPISVLMMQDEAGPDEKIVAGPVEKLNRYYAKVETHTDLPSMLRDQIAHFFRHYKDLEEGKWVRVTRCMSEQHAGEMILKSIARVEKEK
jgi:inorganic pyrophosphatase